MIKTITALRIKRGKNNGSIKTELCKKNIVKLNKEKK